MAEEKVRQTDRQTNKQTNKQTDRQTKQKDYNNWNGLKPVGSWKNFSICKQNRVDQSVPLLWLVLTKPLKHGFQGFIPSLNHPLQIG